MIKILANSKNYNSAIKRAYSDVHFIIIHYTAGRGDTAENEGNYFHNNVVRASANYFVGRDGTVVLSVPLSHTAYSVGGAKYPDCRETGGGKMYGIIRNANSVSIELCDNLDKDPSEAQIEAVKELIKHIKRYCKNIKGIYRHFDVNGKHCPARMMDNKRWNAFKKAVI